MRQSHTSRPPSPIRPKASDTPAERNAEDVLEGLEPPFSDHYFPIFRQRLLCRRPPLSDENVQEALFVLIKKDYRKRAARPKASGPSEEDRRRTLDWYATIFGFSLEYLPGWLLAEEYWCFSKIETRDRKPNTNDYFDRFGDGQNVLDFVRLVAEASSNSPPPSDLIATPSDTSGVLDELPVACSLHDPPKPLDSLTTPTSLSTIEPPETASTTDDMADECYESDPPAHSDLPRRTTNVGFAAVLIALSIFGIGLWAIAISRIPEPASGESSIAPANKEPETTTNAIDEPITPAPSKIASPDPSPNLPFPEPIRDKPKIRPEPIRVLRGHEGIVWRLAFSPDGQYLLSGSYSHFKVDNTVRMWEVESGRQIVKLQDHQWEIMGLAYCPKDSTLAAACSSTEWATDYTAPTVVVYKSGSQWRKFSLPPRPAIRGIAMSDDGTKVFVCRGDGTLVSWDLKTQTELPAVRLLPMNVPVDIIWCAAFSADRHRVFGGLGIGEVVVWDTATGDRLKSFPCPVVQQPEKPWFAKSRVVSIALSPDDKRMVTSSNDYTIRVWDVETGKEERTLNGHENAVAFPEERRAACVTFSPDGRRIISGGIDSTLRVWDVETGKQLAIYHGHIGGIQAVAVSPDGRIAATGGTDKTIRLWQLP